MRLLAGLALCATVSMAQAATLDVSVIEGSNPPQKFSFDLSSNREHIDLRTASNYPAAFNDPATKKDICRDGMYQTGLLLTLRPIEADDADSTPLEIVGYVSSLSELKPGKVFSCGTDHEPVLETSEFSDTTKLFKNRTKVLVIDSKYTLLVTLR